MAHFFILFVGLSIVWADSTPKGKSGAKTVQLYTLDCGGSVLSDLSMMSDTGWFNGRSGKMANPCFLIHHRNEWMLWDTGLGDDHVNHPIEGPGFRDFQDVSLISQLEKLSLRPSDIKYIAFSHLHYDHTGNANRFPNSTWIMQRSEYRASESKSTPYMVKPKTFNYVKRAKVLFIDNDHDVFGDGLVRILATPGHTVGHQVLQVTLQKAGVVILGGDLYYSRESRAAHQIPLVCYSRAETLASRARIDEILRRLHGRLVIQHDTEDFAAMPKFPAFLD